MAELDLVVKVLTKGTRELDSLSSKLDQAGKRATIGLTFPLIAAGAAVTSLAADAEKSQAKLESVFDSMGASAFTTVDALEAQAEAMARLTTFDDDAVKEAQATLLTFSNVTGETFDRAVESSADLAAFFETDMADASLKLGKALQDPVEGMSRLGRQGIIFTDEQEALVESLVAAGDVTAAQGVILDEVARQVGSVAEDLAETSGGKMTQAMNQLGEAGEAIGVFLLPVLAQLATWLTSAATWFTSLDPAIQQFIVGLAAVAAAVGPVILVGTKLVQAFQLITTAFNVMKLALLTNPFTALAVAAAAIAAVIILNWDKITAAISAAVESIKEFMAGLGRAIEDVWNGILEVLGSAVDSVAEIGRKIWKPIGKGFEAAIDFIKGIWNSFVRFWNGIQITVPSVDIPLVGRVGGFSVGLPDLPYLAEGGIVNRPTLAVLGEAGPEAVIPLDRHMGPQELHIHLYNMGDPIEEDDDVLESLRLLVPHIRDAVFSNG